MFTVISVRLISVIGQLIGNQLICPPLIKSMWTYFDWPTKKLFLSLFYVLFVRSLPEAMSRGVSSSFANPSAQWNGSSPSPSQTHRSLKLRIIFLLPWLKIIAFDLSYNELRGLLPVFMGERERDRDRNAVSLWCERERERKRGERETCEEWGERVFLFMNIILIRIAIVKPYI